LIIWKWKKTGVFSQKILHKEPTGWKNPEERLQGIGVSIEEIHAGYATP